MTAHYLRDHRNKPSSMRLMSFISLLTAVGIGAYSTVAHAQIDNQLVLYFLVSAFAPKAVQRFAEKGE